MSNGENPEILTLNGMPIRESLFRSYHGMLQLKGTSEMEIWVNNSIWVAMLLSVGCWRITKLTWIESLAFFVRLPVSATATLIIMYSAALFASLLLHLAMMPSAVMKALADAPEDLIFYFFESGAETALFWVPVMVIRLIILSHVSFRM